MIKWLLTDLEDAYTSDAGVASKVWDCLDVEMPPPLWDDVPPPAAPATVVDDDLLWRNCMWGGRCSSHDHGAFSTRCGASPQLPATTRRAVGAGESVLKSSVLVRAQQPSPPPSPPPGEVPDCEKEMVFVSMTDVVCDVRWTARPAPSLTALQVHEDHSYHLTKHSRPLRLDHLGVQTPSDSGTDDDFCEDEILEELADIDADDVDFFGPESVFKDIAESVAAEIKPTIKKEEPASETESCHRMSDSEEEIDVVSVAVEKARTLPTNPSVRDRRELQQTMADAVGRRGRRPHHHHRRHHHRHHHHHRRRRDRSTHKPARKPKKRRRVVVVSDADDSDDDGSKRTPHKRNPHDMRSLHNDMERQRRIDLSNLVRAVRQLVPSICDKARAPRIVVLREAAHYCRQLQVEATQLASYKQELLRVNNKLQSMHQLALQNLPAKSLRNLHHRAGPHRSKSRRSKNSSY